jgi:hypothetical protein
VTGVAEQREGFWTRLFSGSYRSVREERVIEYIIHRINDGARLRNILGEEYVRRNASPDEIEEILARPELVSAARESLAETFESGELDWKRRPET